jgi:hypothetical protein
LFLAPKLETGFSAYFNKYFIIEPYINVDWVFILFTGGEYKVDHVINDWRGDFPEMQYSLGIFDGGIRIGYWF